MISHTNNIGFSFLSHKGSPRLQLLTIDNEVIDKFIKCIDHLDVQSIEYKPFLRFYIANCLNELTKNTLGLCLLDILKNRQTGAVLLQYENDKSLVGEQFIDFNILLSTAISHLIGLPNLDSMSGKFYARFSVKNEDNSDSYLRQAHRRMELHNDGTYVKEKTDWVIMQKILELNVEGGGSLLLHLDDWDELEKFHSHPVAKEDIQWGSPSSKNISYKTTHPIFIEEEGEEPIMSFIDQFAEPANMNQGLYLYELGESLEKDSNTYNIKLSEGSMLIINNYFWLHGRDMFFANKDLHRELLRQRGVFIQ
ncbi:protein CsiD [Candidatus Pseudothioglobus singularis]|jgi:protein CsiD|uniref:glutarate dioxygenase GlaH n=1 Tax=Candidatus Pseudothioglobus singularis TaxID=1427364 RepID=UPI0008060B4A|nr:glutarate dioxygenase GlaH [Candidatus Pseudothioglobus singularis]ANQ66240.1 protein CsiD [Candidatus Pseudothioglobus singularis]